MSDIYDLHEKAFNRVSAFVVLRDGERVATVALKFPADGAGRLYAYIHWIGLPMVRGLAGGYGYDKRTAACADAARRMDIAAADNAASETGIQYAEGRPWFEYYSAFVASLRSDCGDCWDRALEKAGFTVLQAV